MCPYTKAYSLDPADPKVCDAALPPDTAIAFDDYILKPNNGLSVTLPFLICDAPPE